VNSDGAAADHEMRGVLRPPPGVFLKSEDATASGSQPQPPGTQDGAQNGMLLAERVHVGPGERKCGRIRCVR
jgi:hypothetical protein